MNIKLVRKSGGDINIGILLWFNMIIMVIVSLGRSNVSTGNILINLKKQHQMHLIKLETYYYIRNEINDGDYTDLKYDNQDLSIIVDFKLLESVVKMSIVSNDKSFTLEETYKYSSNCKCLSEFLP